MNKFYPLEVDSYFRSYDGQTKKAECEAFDKRYEEVGGENPFWVSQLTIEKQSGVFERVMGLPLADKYVSEETRENQRYGFWTRTTLDWNIECETDGRTRKEVLQEFEAQSGGAHNIAAAKSKE